MSNTDLIPASKTALVVNAQQPDEPLRWRIGSNAKRPNIHPAVISLCFVADSLCDDGRTPREAPGPIVPLARSEYPELAGTTPESLTAAFEATSEGQRWLDAQRHIAELEAEIAETERGLNAAEESELTRESFALIGELREQLECDQKRLQIAVEMSQPIYDAANDKMDALLKQATERAAVDLIAKQKSILREIVTAIDPILDRLAINHAALKRHDHGIPPSIGNRPSCPYGAPKSEQDEKFPEMSTVVQFQS